MCKRRMHVHVPGRVRMRGWRLVVCELCGLRRRQETAAAAAAVSAAAAAAGVAILLAAACDVGGAVVAAAVVERLLVLDGRALRQAVAVGDGGEVAEDVLWSGGRWG